MNILKTNKPKDKSKYIKARATKYINAWNKILSDACKGKINNDNFYIFIGDIADHIRAYKLVEKGKFKEAYYIIADLDTASRERWDEEIWEYCEKIAHPEEGDAE